jgi:hypothetical protein
MAEILAIVGKLVDRPSTVWRLAWLLFCLVVLCLFGARTLRRIVPFVLIGIAEPKEHPTDIGVADDDGHVADWILPAACWVLVSGVVAALLLRR